MSHVGIVETIRRVVLARCRVQHHHVLGMFFFLQYGSIRALNSLRKEPVVMMGTLRFLQTRASAALITATVGCLSVLPFWPRLMARWSCLGGGITSFSGKRLHVGASASVYLS